MKYLFFDKINLWLKPMSGIEFLQKNKNYCNVSVINSRTIQLLHQSLGMGMNPQHVATSNPNLSTYWGPESDWQWTDEESVLRE